LLEIEQEESMGIRDIGDNVRRFMKLRELTIPNLSARMGMGTAALSNLLNGKAEPKSSTLIKLAEALHVTLNDLLSDTPRLRSLRFRTAKILSGREKAERDQLRHDTAIWLADYSFLEDALNKRVPFKLANISEQNPETASMEARKALGILADKPVYDISDLMEKAGIKLRVRPFGFKKTFGLSVGEEDGGPAVIVNSEIGITVERQIFTIAHELGHLILHKGSYGAASEVEDDREENEANLFAGVFLVPDEGLRNQWEESKGLHWVDRVLHIKRIYKVSYMTILVRLIQLYPALRNRPLITEFRSEYAGLHKHDLKDHYEPNAIEGPVATIDPQGLDTSDLVEDRFVRLVREAYEGGKISIGRAGEMLNRSLEDMRALARAWQEL
jgi:Zn-dependent peptidase ImmA (M78 family)/DNA-binding Xre family transcriptional regulator